jgi:poly-gamma-glutamate capsule biosynthesis protein CapA/YwtB (metallophosphatase superfamily)
VHDLVKSESSEAAMRIALCLIFFCAISLNALQRPVPVENFDDGQVVLTSFADEDTQPDSCAVDTTFTHDASAGSLHLWGDTWKEEAIESVDADSGSVWSVAAYVGEVSEIQGIGFGDAQHMVFYVLAGTEEVDPDIWVTVYQGAFEEETWETYLLPVGDDFRARFDYFPTITRIVYVNDQDADEAGEIWFDDISDISMDRPVAPSISILYDQGRLLRHRDGSRTVSVQFHSVVQDPDSDTFTYYWNFGDGGESAEAEPQHDFTVTDDHPYTVRLEVTDETDRRGVATTQVEVDPGTSSLPFTINFAGDTMLARGYLNGGVIINQGVDAVFNPTKHWFGDAADISVVNLECCFTNATVHHPTKSIYFKGRPQDLIGLVNAGIDVVTIANNHTYDYLEAGLVETETSLQEQGIPYSGAGEDNYHAYQPLFYSQDGVNIAFLASCDRTGQYNNAQPFLQAGENKGGFALLTPYYLQQQLEAVDGLADLKIVELHSGSEYSTAPGQDYDKSGGDIEEATAEDEEYSPTLDVPQMWDIELRHFAVDQGADLVVVNHPHILQGLEYYHGTLIAHSLGNFTFDMTYPETLSSIFLRTTYDGERFTKYDVTPIFIDSTIPQRAVGALGRHILDYLARRSRDLGTYLEIDPQRCTAEVIIDSAHTVGEAVPQTIQPAFSQSGDAWITQPLDLARQGSISQLSASVDELQYRLGRDVIWWGSMEDEGCTLWNLNSNYESYNTDQSHGGERSIRVGGYSGDDGVTVNQKYRVKCESDSISFTVAGWIRTENAGEVRLGVRYYATRDQAAYLGEEYFPDISGTTEWQYYNLPLTIPEGTKYFDIRLFGHFTSTDGYAWFDDVNLIQWTNWGELSGVVPFNAPNDFYFLQLQSASDPLGPTISYAESSYRTEIPPVNDEDANAPVAYGFTGPAPNPFNPEARVSFTLGHPARVQLGVYNLRGQLIRTVVDDDFAAGNHRVGWNGRDGRNRQAGSGLYLFRLQVDGKTAGVVRGVLLK